MPIKTIETFRGFDGKSRQADLAISINALYDTITEQMDSIPTEKELLTLGVLCAGNYTPSVSTFENVQNDYRELYQCLLYNRDYADKIMVVCNHKNPFNRSVVGKIAFHFGARCFDVETESFSVMRNAITRNAQTEFVLMLDVDEGLRGQPGQLKTILKDLQPETLGLIVDIENIFKTEDGKFESQLEQYTRIVRVRDDLFYEGVIHEDIMPSILNASDGSESILALQNIFRAMEADPIYIKHAGYATAEIRAMKSLRNLAILNRAIDLEPRPSYFLFRALEHLNQGNFEGSENDIGTGLLLFEREEFKILVHEKAQLLALGAWTSLITGDLSESGELINFAYERAIAALKIVDILKLPKLVVAECMMRTEGVPNSMKIAANIYQTLLNERNIYTKEWVPIRYEIIAEKLRKLRLAAARQHGVIL